MDNILSRFSLRGKAALVTGAARGLGRAFAEALAQAGADVCIGDLDLEAAVDTARAIAEAWGVRAVAAGGDVSDPQQVQAMADLAVSELGGLDICVANAGLYIGQPAEEMSAQVWNKTIAVNLSGAFFTAQAAARHMAARDGGSIIFTTSINAHTASASPGCAYCASKGGLLALARDLANEWGKYDIRVNCISPGNMDTEILTREWRDSHQKKYEEGTVMGRLGKPRELQGALVYLASGASSYTTGAEIVIDGGFIIK